MVTVTVVQLLEADMLIVVSALIVLVADLLPVYELNVPLIVAFAFIVNTVPFSTTIVHVPD